MGLPAGDWDIATSARPEAVQRLFPRTVPVGIDHGTVGVLTRGGILVEVTTFRRDVETFGRKAKVEFSDTLEEDLSRRDFTINSVAWHPVRDQYVDPFRGREDLASGLLKTVGLPRRRFAEDYLRVLRGLRFSGRFDLRIEDETWRALCQGTSDLYRLSPERIREEMVKVLSGDPRPSGTLALYHLSGALHAVYPEVAAVSGCRRPGSGEDLFVHSLLSTDFVSARKPLDRLALMVQGIGAPAVEGGEETSWADRGRDRAVALLLRLRWSKAEIEHVSSLVHAGLEAPLALADAPALRHWLHQVGPERVHSLGRLWLAKARLDRLRLGTDPRPLLAFLARLREELAAKPPLSTGDLAIDGRDLIRMGLRPGPAFGAILDRVMDLVLDDPSLNQEDTLLAIVEDLAGEFS